MFPADVLRTSQKLIFGNETNQTLKVDLTEDKLLVRTFQMKHCHITTAHFTHQVVTEALFWAGGVKYLCTLCSSIRHDCYLGWEQSVNTGIVMFPSEVFGAGADKSFIWNLDVETEANCAFSPGDESQMFGLFFQREQDKTENNLSHWFVLLRPGLQTDMIRTQAMCSSPHYAVSIKLQHHDIKSLLRRMIQLHVSRAAGNSEPEEVTTDVL